MADDTHSPIVGHSSSDDVAVRHPITEEEVLLLEAT
jgi:hypothetical protein